MMLPARLSATLAIRLLARQPRTQISRCLGTSQVSFESETSKLIRLRREREAKEEQTTGFDKMLQLNELHLQILRKNETPEIRKKRNLAMLKMAAMFGLFIVGLTAVAGLAHYLFYKYVIGKDLFDLERGHYVQYTPFKYRPNRINQTTAAE